VLLDLDGVTVNVNGTDFWSNAARGVGFTNNMTISSTYIVSPSGNVFTDYQLRMHELGHVGQARDLGVLYLPAYGLLYLATGAWLRTTSREAIYRNHPMEINANERARLPMYFHAPLNTSP
jgi:hypothetical protein